ncbi:hypothetical protein OF83DRAFT_1058389, partial [Amylostereum chailletii]
QVENKLYKIHHHFLSKHSSVFRDMFALPVSLTSSGESEGDSDEHPICLSGVTALEFESLMKVFYHRCNPGFQLSQAEWIAVLSIAHRFELHSIYQRATQNLLSAASDAEVVPLLAAAERYDISFSNIPNVLRAIVRRAEELTSQEFDMMSGSLASKVATARERWVRGWHGAKCQDCGSDCKVLTLRCVQCRTTILPPGEFQDDERLQIILKDVWGIE